MKRPKYLTTEELIEGDDKYPAFTEIQVIWNEDYIPEHHKDKMKEAKRLDLRKEHYYMCIVGRKWIVLGKSQFTERR